MADKAATAAPGSVPGFWFTEAGYQPARPTHSHQAAIVGKGHQSAHTGVQLTIVEQLYFTPPPVTHLFAGRHGAMDSGYRIFHTNSRMWTVEYRIFRNTGENFL